MYFEHGFDTYDSLLEDYNKAVNTGDSLLITKRLKDLAGLEMYRGDYNMAFDRLWEAQIIADNNNYQKLLIPINRSIGILYDIFVKDSLAMYHFKEAIKIANRTKVSSEWMSNQQKSNYYSISNFWRTRANYKLAVQYLDSSRTVYGITKETPLVWADLGFCYLQLGNISAAKKFLYKAISNLERKKLTYNVPALMYLGELKMHEFQLDSALHYYRASLEYLELNQVHVNLKPALLEKISNIYIQQGNLPQGIAYLRASKNSFEKIFSTTGIQNKGLFEIKSKYKEHLDSQQRTIGSQQIIIEEKNTLVFRLIVILILITLLTIGSYITIRQRNKLHKLALVQQLDHQKSEEVIRIKTKELTANSLKMIELEESIRFLLDEIKELDKSKYAFLRKRFGKKQNHSWEEFNKRFVELNNKFQVELCAKYPDLTPSELKHCALIKLKLDNHEISKLLNISQQSLHTSRYRIRKKIGLESSANLTSFIDSL